ncbi:OmpP1/FadL family transporter [Litoreibacter albidus]|uniref:OmpP1/FadL family transporter n=1 Tax=Litoreibacter albidus TaxID=670155 RepID=UPI0037363E89
MNKLLSATAILAASTSIVSAGGIDRSGQSIAPIFETGNYAELSFGSVSPTVSGTATVPFGSGSSGNMSGDYSLVGLAYKYQFNDKLSFTLIYDEPFGADVNYPAATTYFARGATATLESQAITGLLRYKIDENWSVHGGLRYQSLEAIASIPFAANYTAQATKDYGVGYVVGAAYERPDIALRVALTYSSEIAHSLSTVETGPAAVTSPTNVETPQSVNLDFQTGIAPDTLLFGSVRWVDWSDFDISPTAYGFLPGNPSLVSYRDDTVTYNIGIGRRFNENWSGAVSLGYEKSNGGFSSNLGPTDGNISIGLGGSYTNGGVKVSGGVRYIKIGNAQTTLGTSGATASNFTDNKAIAVGLKIGYSY